MDNLIEPRTNVFFLFQAFTDLRYQTFPEDAEDRRKLGTKKKYSDSRPQSNHLFNQHATEGQLQTLNKN